MHSMVWKTTVPKAALDLNGPLSHCFLSPAKGCHRLVWLSGWHAWIPAAVLQSTRPIYFQYHRLGIWFGIYLYFILFYLLPIDCNVYNFGVSLRSMSPSTWTAINSKFHSSFISWKADIHKHYARFGIWWIMMKQSIIKDELDNC